MKSRAAILHDVGGPWYIEEFELDAPRAGEVLVSPVGGHSPIRVPKGLIHDWFGATLIQNAGLEDIFAVVRDYDRYREFYKPLVIDSKSLGGDGTDYRFSLLMLNKSLFAKTALASEWNGPLHPRR